MHDVRLKNTQFSPNLEVFILNQIIQNEFVEKYATN
jgi:hypothetical protein